ncbi:hypothetical protein HPP92_028611 [Vanilla planifolia]|uniref:Uncharacterized protein n=1 Tax=Vanilla planifolia TaxID=51239 RepID=A0A835P6R7_VANPL|nr:hypothetical protein HPP92_028611 [Vanilla planifolia]
MALFVDVLSQVGDAGPVLDMLAVTLENLSASAQVARSTVSAVYRTAQMISFSALFEVKKNRSFEINASIDDPGKPSHNNGGQQIGSGGTNALTNFSNPKVGFTA